MTEQQLASKHPTSARVLAFIRGYVGSNHVAPTLREVGKGVGLSSASTVEHHMLRLKSLGFLTYQEHKPRTIVLTEKKS